MNTVTNHTLTSNVDATAYRRTSNCSNVTLNRPFSAEMRIGKIMSMAASDFPPKAVREIVQDVASLLKERKETVSVAETVRITV